MSFDDIASLRNKYYSYYKSVEDAADKEARSNPEATMVLIKDIMDGLMSEADKGRNVYMWHTKGIPPKRIEQVLYILRKDYIRLTIGPLDGVNNNVVRISFPTGDTRVFY